MVDTRYSEMLKFSLLFTLFCIIIVLALMLLNSMIKNAKTSAGIGIVVMTILSAIRCNFGSDYFNYFTQYNSIKLYFQSPEEILKVNIQSGFPLLAYTVKSFFENQFAIFVVIAIMASIIIFKIIMDNSEMPILSFSIWIFGGFFLMSTNILKQYIAMVFIFLAFQYFKKKKISRFAIFSVLAIMFHVTALPVMVTIFFVNRIRLSFSFLIFGSIISLFLGFFSGKLFNVITRIPLFNKYMERYLTETGIDFSDIKLILNTVLVSLALFGVSLFIIMVSKKVTFDSDIIFYTKLIIISVFISLVSINFFYFGRISYYYAQFLILLLPNAITKMENKQLQKKYLRMIYGFLAIFCFCFTILSGENNYYNYSTIFTDTPISVKEFVIYGGN